MRNGGAAHKNREAPRNFDSTSRIVIPSVAEGSFLHCGQYHISTGPETTPWYYVFLLSHILRLAVCKKDFSLRSK